MLCQLITGTDSFGKKRQTLCPVLVSHGNRLVVCSSWPVRPAGRWFPRFPGAHRCSGPSALCIPLLRSAASSSSSPHHPGSLCSHVGLLKYLSCSVCSLFWACSFITVHVQVPTDHGLKTPSHQFIRADLTEGVSQHRAALTDQKLTTTDEGLRPSFIHFILFFYIFS